MEISSPQFVGGALVGARNEENRNQLESCVAWRFAIYTHCVCRGAVTGCNNSDRDSPILKL